MAKEQELFLQTELKAEFVLNPKIENSPELITSVAAMNVHVAEIAETLQKTFRALVLDMMDLKRPHYTKEKEPTDERSQSIKVSPHYRKDR